MLQEKFSPLLKKETDAVLIVSEENRRYLTGFPASDGFLAVTRGDAVFFTDSRYIEAAEKNISVCRCNLLTSFEHEIAPYFEAKGVKRVLTESDRLTVTTHKRLKRLLPLCTVTASAQLDSLLDECRSRKNEDEIKKIMQAQRIAEDAFSHICSFMKPGLTEKEVSLELDFYMLSHGAEALSFETIAVSGKNGSMPHGVPGENILQYGDFVTLDFGAVCDGYHSDMTRTVALGEPCAEQKEIYQIVLTAQKEALAALKPGVLCSEADAAARSVIEKAGYGAFFGHGTGHGVGIEIHEKPNLSPRSRAILCEGNVVTVEPGIYLPKKFGVRIEDMALITKDGAQNLTTSPKELIVL